MCGERCHYATSRFGLLLRVRNIWDSQSQNSHKSLFNVSALWCCWKQGKWGTPASSLSALWESSREKRRHMWKPCHCDPAVGVLQCLRDSYCSCTSQEMWLASLLRDHITDLISKLRYFPKITFPIWKKKLWLVKRLKARHIFWPYSTFCIWCLLMSQKWIPLLFPDQIFHLLHKIVNFPIVQWFWWYLAWKMGWKLSLTLHV